MLRKVTFLLAFTSLASGCADFQAQIDSRYGPSPVPIAEAVDSSTKRQVDVVMAMARGALPPGQAPATAEEWYRVILAGFNVVDDACISYIDDLWILERRRTRNSALIAAAGAATSGIVAATSNPNALTLAILAQAFGLASALNTAISDTYLYSQNAATIKKLIRGTTEAYRADLATNFKSDGSNSVKYPMASVPAAYHHMREYLALCLPPTIQAQIEDLVTNAKAGPVGSDPKKNPPGGGTTPSALVVPPAASSPGRVLRTSPSIRVF